MAKRNLRAVDAINARIAAGSRMRSLDGNPGDETKQHQPVSEFVRQLQRFEYARLGRSEICQGPSPIFDTHLQYQYIRSI